MIQTDDGVETTQHAWPAYASVLFNNLRDFMEDEIEEMYRKARSNKESTMPYPWLSYEYIDGQYENYQSQWPERLWNYQQKIAYINNYIKNKGNYLQMLMGTKEQQRRYWLANRFAYLDSKYYTGESRDHYIQFRANTPADGAKLSMKYIAPIWGSINWKAGTGYTNFRRQKVVDTTKALDFESILESGENQEVYVYSANYITSIDGLGDFYPNLLDASDCTNLKSISIKPTTGFNETNWETFTLGTAQKPMPLLETVDISNNKNFRINLDVSYAPGLKQIIAENTNVASIIIPEAAPIERLKYPDTIKTIRLNRNNKLNVLSIPVENNSHQITTLDIQYMNQNIFNVEQFIDDGKCSQNKTCALTWKMESFGTLSSPANITDVIAYFSAVTEDFKGPGEAQKPIIVIDNLYVNSYSTEQKQQLLNLGVQVTKWYGTQKLNIVFKSENGSTTYKTIDANYGDYIVYSGATPTKATTDQYTYEWDGWTEPDGTVITDKQYHKNAIKDIELRAHFKANIRSYTITWKNTDY